MFTQVNIAECIVEDLDAQGATRGGPGASDKPGNMIRIKHKDPRQSTVKDHNALVLRAESIDQKMQWLTRLRKAAEPPRRPAGKVSLCFGS